MEWRVIARSRGLRRDRQSSIAAAAFTRGADRRIIVGRGDVAQLGERRVRNAKVEGSIPFVSTTNLRPTLLRRPCRLQPRQIYFVTHLLFFYREIRCLENLTDFDCVTGFGRAT